MPSLDNWGGGLKSLLRLANSPHILCKVGSMNKSLYFILRAALQPFKLSDMSIRNLAISHHFLLHLFKRKLLVAGRVW